MRKKYYSIGRFLTSTAICSAMLATQTSCVNDDYDISDDNLDKEILVGGSLALPVGTTKPITLGELLDDIDIEDLEETLDGGYKISMSDSISESVKVSDGGITIDEISVNKEIDSEFSSAEFPAFNPNIEGSEIDISTSLTKVDLGAATKLNEGSQITFDSGIDFTIANQTITEELPLNEGTTKYDISIAGVECPTQVVSASNIKFGDNGAEALLTIDLTNISSKFLSDKPISITLPSLKITMPDGFVLDNDKNYIEATDLEAENGIIELPFSIMSLNKTLNNNGGKLDDITGEIECQLPNYINVSGTTNGEDLSQMEIDINFDAELTISDMDLEVAGVNVAVDAMNVCDNITIDGIPTVISSVENVYLENSSMSISIGSIEVASLKSQNTDDIIYLEFPKSKFELASSSSLQESATLYRLPIDLGDITSGSDYSSSLTFKTIKLGNESLVEVEVDGKKSQKIDFDPEINTTSATLSLGGSMSLSEFNDYVENDQDQTMKIEISTSEWGIESANIVTNDIMVEFETESEEIKVDTEIPSELARIDSILFKDKVTADIDVLVAVGMDSELSFDNYTIEFPDFIIFAASAGVVDQKLVLNEEFDKVSTGTTCKYQFTRSLEIEKLDFTKISYDIIKDGKLSLDEAITLGGGIKMASANTSSEASTSAKSDVSFKINEMTVSKAYGIVAPEIEIEGSEVDLSDLADELDGEFAAVLTAPTITMTAVNELNIPVEITSLVLQPVKDGVNKDKIYTTSTINIEAAPIGGKATTEICIVASEDQKGSETGVQYVVMNNFKNILADLPDAISIEVEAGVAAPAAGENHMVDLTVDSYNFSVNYSIDIPLTFDEFSLDYTINVEDLNKDLEDVLGYISSISLEITADNTLPVEVEITEITPLGTDGKELALDPIVVDGSQTIKANSSGSVVKLNLTDKNDLLKNLDALDIRIQATIDSTEGGQELKSDQQIKLGVKAYIPNGLSVNLDDAK